MRSDSNKTFKLDAWKKGSPLTAAHLQQSHDAIKTLTSGVALPRQVPLSLSIKSGVGAGGGSSIIRMTLTGVVDFSFDTILAVDADGVEHIIAKPFLLRPSLNVSFDRDGVTFTYSYDDGETRRIDHTFGAPENVRVEQTEKVIPFYGTDDIFVVMLPPETIGDLSIVPGLPGNLVADFADLNVAGRAWGATKTVETPL